ncbi:hypothetical protein MNBD_GAMMA10-2373 [hydrothermal vent metagenome]|uniref:Uncharacterized protein n=1 Tax=hydrothermal vent metagenome TaxID=652676 RepID=A0A3B0XKK3_9ZZZZ
MDINNHVYIWVTDINSTGDLTILNGLSYDGEYGFGQENVRSYTGSLVALSDKNKILLEAELSTIHIAGKGTLWNINVNNLPNVPFLLTNNTELNGPVRQKITISPTEETLAIFQRDSEESYPVISKKLVGILEHSNENDILIGFTVVDDQFVSSDGLEFSEWGLEVGNIAVD